VSVRALYDHADRSINERIGVTMGLTTLLATRPYELDGPTVDSHRARHAAIRRFQERTLELFRASLDGEADPEIARVVLGDAPPGFGADYHRALTTAQHRVPVFFRTDEFACGRLSEIQCSGSGWGFLEQLRDLYDAWPQVYGPPRHFPVPPARAFAEQLRDYLPQPPIVHHLVDNASRPHGMRYFIQRLRDEGVRFFGYDADVRPEDCNFIRAHDFVSLPHHNFFVDRMERCDRGEVFFDLPPSLLFDGKVILAWPFWSKTRDAYDDEIRALFPHTSLIESDGVDLPDGERITLDGLRDVPRRSRSWYLKYGGSDIAVNWGSKAVFLARTLSNPGCAELLDRIRQDLRRGRPWILQEAVRRAEPATAFARDGGTFETEAYAKLSSFYGPGGLVGVLAMQLRSHKVHGSADTILSMVH
jgi:hypothetical protein